MERLPTRPLHQRPPLITCFRPWQEVINAAPRNFGTRGNSMQCSVYVVIVMLRCRVCRVRLQAEV